MLLMIDNFDSFTYNLVQYFNQLDVEVVVKRNNEISIQQIRCLEPQYIVISPGPRAPDQAGISLAVIEYFATKLPILGVCLGHQVIAQAFGGNIIRANQVMHGKTSMIIHNRNGLFRQLNSPLKVTRYHSLLVEQANLPDCFEITAWIQDDQGRVAEIMAISHKKWPIHGIQFHPEAILTEQGHQLLANFISMC